MTCSRRVGQGVTRAGCPPRRAARAVSSATSRRARGAGRRPLPTATRAGSATASRSRSQPARPVDRGDSPRDPSGLSRIPRNDRNGGRPGSRRVRPGLPGRRPRTSSTRRRCPPRPIGWQLRARATRTRPPPRRQCPAMRARRRVVGRLREQARQARRSRGGSLHPPHVAQRRASPRSRHPIGRPIPSTSWGHDPSSATAHDPTGMGAARPVPVPPDGDRLDRLPTCSSW